MPRIYRRTNLGWIEEEERLIRLVIEGEPVCFWLNWTAELQDVLHNFGIASGKDYRIEHTQL